MSHLHLRKEKDCLNCGTIVEGRYCTNCGQENAQPKESAWHLIVHFFNDVTHFDGKFFSSIKYLLTKPGFLTEEYVKGRRASYLNPIRMYLFISAVYFLLLMSVFKNDINTSGTDNSRDSAVTSSTLTKVADRLDSLDKALSTKDDTKTDLDIDGQRITINSTEDSYETVREYDSVQKTLPGDKRDGVVTRYFTRKAIASNQYTKNNKDQVKRQIWANYYHSLPYMLFISLPLMALLFQLFYIRRRKEFYYVSHGIFIIHFYCFVFIILIIIDTFQLFGDWAKLARLALLIWGFVYLYIAMKRFYKQGWFKTFVKYMMIIFFGSLLISILALIFLAKSFLNLA